MPRPVVSSTPPSAHTVCAHITVQVAAKWRLGRELVTRELGAHDFFHALNVRRDGLMTCAELAAGVAWLGLQLDEGDVHALMRALDGDGDGLLSLDEWNEAYPGLNESEPTTHALLADLELPPVEMPTLEPPAQTHARASL